jgi:hypothetical protein
VGILTGSASGVIALDIDPRHGGEASFAEMLTRTGGELPVTAEQKTGGGGRHFLFQHPGFAIRNSAGRLGPGIDVRGDGGYIVVPVSSHASGGRYEWLKHPNDGGLAEVPAWLLASLNVSTKPIPQGQAPFQVPEGSRNTHLFKKGVSLRRQGKSRAVIETSLLEENAAACDPPLSIEEVQRIAENVAFTGMAPLHKWRDLVRSEHGPRHPVTRHILHNLSTYMNTDGRECFPSIETQAVETGLSVRTIKRHLAVAEDEQWLHIYERQGKGKAWRHYGYVARIPDDLVSKYRFLN